MPLKSLKFRISLLLSIGIFILMGVFMGIAITDSYRAERSAAEYTFLENSNELAFDIEAFFSTGIDAAMDLAVILKVRYNESRTLNRVEAGEMLRAVLIDNPSYLAVYSLWEPDRFDGSDSSWINAEGHDSSGRFIPYWTLDANGEPWLRPMQQFDSDDSSQ